MKTKNAIDTKWPMIQVEYHGPRPREIISLEEAQKKYGLDDREVGWLRRGETYGTTVNRSPHGKDVYMLHRYTEDASIRDAAVELLSALEGIMDQDLVPANSVAGRMARAAIKKARR